MSVSTVISTDASVTSAFQWRHNERDGVSNNQPHDCQLIRLFRRRSKKTTKLRVTGLCEGNSPVTVEFPHKRPVTRKMFPYDDVFMISILMKPRQNGRHSQMTFSSAFSWLK